MTAVVLGNLQNLFAKQEKYGGQGGAPVYRDFVTGKRALFVRVRHSAGIVQVMRIAMDVLTVFVYAANDKPRHRFFNAIGMADTVIRMLLRTTC